MPRPRGSRRSAFANSATFAGDQRDAVGPPSALLPTATAFAEQVEASLKAAEAELNLIKEDWAKWTPEQTARLNERCRCALGTLQLETCAQRLTVLTFD